MYNRRQKESVKEMKKRFLAMVLCLCLTICAFPLIAYAEDTEVEVNKEAVLSGLFEADIADIREAILAGVITCREVTQYYLDRIDAYNAPYNCFITLCSDALEQADARDKQLQEGKAEGLLFGIPIVVKDNIDVKGVHTTNGYKKKQSQIAKKNAETVQLLLDEGAVILAKANMCTGAQSAYWSKSEAVGETKNAYNTYYSPAGSSGGSAVSVSLNFAAAALGTDTNSSLRLPAAMAGCYTLRPTFGLVSLDGVVVYNSTRDTVGAITRSASDLTLMMDVLTDGKYSYSQNRDENVLSGLRLGIVKELTYPTKLDTNRTEKWIDPEISAAFAGAVEELKACGVEVVEVSFSDIFYLSWDTSDSGREKFYQEYLKILSKYNVSALIFPSYLSTPLKSGKDEKGKYWDVYDSTKQILLNNCGRLSSIVKIPELTIPIGNHSAGPGIGMEIAAPRNSEQLLLDIAVAYCARYDHRTVPTGAPNDYIASSMGSLRNVLDDYYARLEAAKNPPVTEQEGGTAQASAKADILPAVVVWLCVFGVCGTHFYVYYMKKKKVLEETKQ